MLIRYTLAVPDRSMIHININTRSWKEENIFPLIIQTTCKDSSVPKIKNDILSRTLIATMNINGICNITVASIVLSIGNQ